MTGLKGLATGIGSLPYKDADTALDLIFENTPNIPFWPQLPKRDPREAMVVQFSEQLPFLKIKNDNLVYSCLDEEEGQLEVFYEKVIANDIDYFKISEDYASGLYRFYQRLKESDLRNVEFIKCHVTGPFTFSASVNDKNGVPVLYDKVFMQAVVRNLAMKALWQINFFKEFNKKMILFFDEPYLSCFGSAYTPVTREQVIAVLAELTGIVKSNNVLVGVHCCGNTDWSIFTDTKTIDIISFDAFEFLDRLILYAENLKGFFSRSGILCWGIVPTESFTGEETPDLLVKKIRSAVEEFGKKGIGQDLLWNSLIISPSCGLGTILPEKAEKIFKLLSETSSSIRKYS